MKQNILVVDDEQHILELVEYTLAVEGYVVITAKTGEDGLELLHSKKVDAVILDLMLPGIGGLEVLKSIRADSDLKNLPVLLLTAKNEEFDRVIGLELGADDYLCKPFFVRELSARVKSILRRKQVGDSDSSKTNILEDAGIVINDTNREVTKGGKKVILTLKEFDLLRLFLRNIGRVVTRDEILSSIWGYDFLGETRTVDVHVRQLRKKLFDDDAHSQKIMTIRGVGYRWNED